MRRFVALILAGMMTLGSIGVVYGAEPAVTVGGTVVAFTDAKPFVDENGRTMVPLRPVADAMGIDVEWDRRTKTAVFSETYEPGIEGFGYDIDGNQVYGRIVYLSLSFRIGSPDVEIFGRVEKDNGEMTMVTDRFTMDTIPVVKEGRTYAPLRYMVQTFGYDVGWDAASSTVILEKYRMQ